MSTLPSPDLAPALSPAEIEAFVRDGYLVLRGCFSPEAAAELTHGVLVARSPMPAVVHRKGTGAEPVDIQGLDLLAPATWSHTRLDVETQLRLPIASFAPRLWGAIRSLLGEHEPTRTLMGEQWILNGDLRPPPAPPLLEAAKLGTRWHIDSPSTHTTFADRFDGLVLLVLWSDVAPGGGGPLFSGRSLDSLVRRIEGATHGVDTTGQVWAVGLIDECDDIQQLSGRAGDVVITHPLSLHSAYPNYSTKVRILENPTIGVRRPLDYSQDNPRPSPVEAAVIRRLSRVRRSSAREHAEAAAWLVDHHPDYFLPLRAAWEARVSEPERRQVYAVDVALHDGLIAATAKHVAQKNPAGLPAARACVALVRQLVINQRSIHAHLLEGLTQPDFGATAFARLVRGFVNCEGHNHLLAALLRHFFAEVELFETRDPDTGRSDHLLVRVRDDAGWFFADAWADFDLFWVEGCGSAPIPGVPEHRDLPAHGPVRLHGLYPRRHYELGHVPPQPSRLAGSLALPEASAPAAATPAWKAYLAARVDHLFASAGDPAQRYQAVLDGHAVGGLTRQVVELFAQRSGGAVTTLRSSARDAAYLQLGRALAELRRPQDAEVLHLPQAAEQDALLRQVQGYLDVVCGRWAAVFGPPGYDPPRGFGDAARLALSGDVGAAQELAAGRLAEELRGRPAGAFLAVVLRQLGFTEAALAAFTAGLDALPAAERADPCVELADLEHDLGRDAAAARWCEEALRLQPSDDRLLARVAPRLVRYGAADVAHAALSARCARAPDDPEVLLAYARLLAWAGRAEPAAEVLRRRAALEPADLEVRRLQAVLALLQGDPAAARRSLEALHRDHPHDAETAAWLAELGLRQGDLRSAAQHLATACTTVHTPINILLNALINRSEALEDDDRLRHLLQELGEASDRASWGYEHAAPGGPLARGLRLLDAFGGNRSLVATRIDPTAKSGVRLVGADPGGADLDGRHGSAETLKRITTHGQAEVEADLTRLAAAFPRSPHPLCYRGELYLWLGRYADAAAAFEQALGRSPARWAYVGRAAVALVDGDLEGAKAHLAECDRHFAPIPGATSHVYLGEAHRRAGALEAARHHLREAVAAKPGRVAAWMNLALVQLAIGDPGAALAIAARLEARVPRLLWDAAQAIETPLPTPMTAEVLPPLFEAALRAMRGNRSSHTVTYFDRAGVLRVARDAEHWRALLAQHGHHIARQLRHRLGR